MTEAYRGGLVAELATAERGSRQTTSTKAKEKGGWKPQGKNTKPAADNRR